MHINRPINTSTMGTAIDHYNVDTLTRHNGIKFQFIVEFRVESIFATRRMCEP